jgi:hypothetical protein
VSGYKRVPRPPPRTTARTFFMGGELQIEK